jgi:hypothetical protein
MPFAATAVRSWRNGHGYAGGLAAIEQKISVSIAVALPGLAKKD